MPVIVVKNNLGLIAKGVLALTKSKLLIGIPGDAPSRQPEEGEDTAPPSNAVVGYVQEFGLPEKNIPARPFLVPGVESIAGQASDRLKKAGKDVLFGNFGAVDKALHTIGLIAQNAVRAQITDGTFAPLAEATLKARQARGRTGEKPLIDTSQLRNSVTFVVK